MWERGLKEWCKRLREDYPEIAPRVGAWIESEHLGHGQHRANIAPRVGAWIERYRVTTHSAFRSIAPRVGAWIESAVYQRASPRVWIAPRVGAWIERRSGSMVWMARESLPVWERGLKDFGVGGEGAGR